MEDDLKHCKDDNATRRAAEVATDKERLCQEEEGHQKLATRGRCVQKKILQTKMGDHNVFTTP